MEHASRAVEVLLCSAGSRIEMLCPYDLIFHASILKKLLQLVLESLLLLGYSASTIIVKDLKIYSTESNLLFLSYSVSHAMYNSTTTNINNLLKTIL